jgi:pilus assembly protein TadC
MGRRLIVAVTVAGGALVLATGAWVIAAVIAAAAALKAFAGRAGRPGGRPSLTLSVDLLAGCLGAGASVADALVAAADAAGDGDDAARLHTVAGRLRAGQPADAAWEPLRRDARWQEVAAACARAGRTGAALAPELRRIAARERLRRRTAARASVQRAGVWVVLPLGLCFLPAFVLVGIVPVVLASLPAGTLP